MKHAEILELLDQRKILEKTKNFSNSDFILEKFKKNNTKKFYYCLETHSDKEADFETLNEMYKKYLPKKVKLKITSSQHSKQLFINSDEKDFKSLDCMHDIKRRCNYVYLIRSSMYSKYIFLVNEQYVIQSIYSIYSYVKENKIGLNNILLILPSHIKNLMEFEARLFSNYIKSKIINVDELQNKIERLFLTRIASIFNISHNYNDVVIRVSDKSRQSLTIEYNGVSITLNFRKKTNSIEDNSVYSSNGIVYLIHERREYKIPKICLEDIVNSFEQFTKTVEHYNNDNSNNDNKVYKYRRIYSQICPHNVNQNTIDPHFKSTFKNKDVYFSKRADLNDPYDLYPLKKLKYIFYKSTKITDNNCGIFCTADSQSNEVLWSLYGDAFNGICFEYDEKDILSEIIKTNRAKLIIYGNVKYTLNLPIYLNNIFSIFISRYALVILRTIYLCFYKYTDWKYEKEKRYLVVFDEKDSNTINRIINIPYKKYFLGINVQNNMSTTLYSLLYPNFTYISIANIQNFIIK